MNPKPVKRRKALRCDILGEVAHVHIAGKVCIMDTEDVHVFDGWTPHVTKAGYVEVFGSYTQKPRYCDFVHRLVMKVAPGQPIDHINGNTLDNRKANLRRCSPNENMHNARKNRMGTNPYKGIRQYTGRPLRKPWTAQICVNGRRYSLGCFMTAEEAARAYNDKALELSGPFARLNVIERPGETVSATEVAPCK